MREMNELWTLVTEELITEIRATAARHGGMQNLAWATGIPDRTYRNIFCQRIVSLTVIDKFCTHADTRLWVTDLEWWPWMEMMDIIDPEYREKIKPTGGGTLTHEQAVEAGRKGGLAKARNARAHSLHEQSNAGAEAVPTQEDQAAGSGGEGFQPWTAGDGPRGADSD